MEKTDDQEALILKSRLLNFLGKKKNPAKIITPPEKAFLISEEYQNLMRERLPLDGSHDLNEAENQTRNYRFRMHEVDHRLGIWRWRGMQGNLEKLLDIFGASDTILDFGGAACPLGMGSIVVDMLEVDRSGEPVKYHDLNELDFKADLLFSSHTLEHIKDLESLMPVISKTVKPDGKFVFHLPAWTCTRWWPGIHSNHIYNDHVWSFGLSGTTLPDQIPEYLEIDTFLSDYFQILEADYCGDNSILIIARNGN